MSSEYMAMLASKIMRRTQAPNSWFRNNFKNFRGSSTTATGSTTLTPLPAPMASDTALDTFASSSRMSLRKNVNTHGAIGKARGCDYLKLELYMRSLFLKRM